LKKKQRINCTGSIRLPAVKLDLLTSEINKNIGDYLAASAERQRTTSQVRTVWQQRAWRQQTLSILDYTAAAA